MYFLLPLLIILALVAGYLVGLVRAQRAAAAELAAARREAVAAQARLDAERQHSAEALQTQADALRAEFRVVATELARNEGRTLRTEHLNSLETLLQPLGKDIATFREQFIKGHADMDRYIKDLMTQTSTMGREAEELARALRSNNKTLGNWGETVLANILESAGLAAGRDYTLQEHTKDDEGRDLIPDVVVHLPGHRNVVIDSKVSLTAFTDYVAADGDAAAQARLLKEHVASVRRHILELSKKDYGKVVRDNIGYVLMFIPGEAAYVAAVTAAPELATEAYSRHVILLNPTNLLMALQLTYNLWQSELQSRSVKEIYTSAERLYKKFCLFAKSFSQVGQGIRQLSTTYERAEKQLATGRGNIVTQLEGWKKKGLTTAAELPDNIRQLNTDADADVLALETDAEDEERKSHAGGNTQEF